MVIEKKSESIEEHYNDQILRALRKIILRVSGYSRILARKAGITVPQLMVMKAISQVTDEEVSLITISQKVQLSPPTVSGIVDRLERGHLVVRSRKADDRRKVSLVLTEKGRELLKSQPPALQEVFTERLEKLPLEDQQQILQVLDQVVELMQAERIDAAPMLIAEDKP